MKNTVFVIYDTIWAIIHEQRLRETARDEFNIHPELRSIRMNTTYCLNTPVLGGSKCWRMGCRTATVSWLDLGQ